MFPNSWREIQEAPVFLISRDEERFEICKGRIRRAGFVGEIQRSHGVNPDELGTKWGKHVFEPAREPFGRHPAAVMLAHLDLWADILKQNIPYTVVFEDDPLFHTEWDTLAHRYYDATPKGCDMIFMGHHCGNVYPDAHIIQTHVYCLNAYLITCDGARKLYDMITRYPHEDFGVIDMMLARLQYEVLFSQNNPYNYSWYAWNSQMYPDELNEGYKHPDARAKDMGLVFQQNPFFRLETDL